MPEYTYRASYERPGTPHRPSDDAIEASMAAISFEHTAIPLLEELLDAFRARFSNGGAVAARFRLSGVDETYRWFATLDRLESRHGYDLSTRLLTSDGFRRALPDLDSRNQRAEHLEDATFERVHPLEFDGQLATWLFDGSIYTSAPMKASEAKRLGTAAVAELIADRYEAFTIYRTLTSWAHWLSDLLRATWVIIDRERDIATVLCVADSD
jgi:hypothetical protein